jgi:hypothetical protein
VTEFHPDRLRATVNVEPFDSEGGALGAALSSSYCRHAFDRTRHCGMQQIGGSPRRTQSS